MIVAAVRSLDDPDPAPVAHLTSGDVQRIAHRVERLRGVRFTKPVRPVFLDREEAVELLERAGRAEYPRRDQLIDEETAKLLGLLEPKDSLSQVLDRVDQEQVLGFYDDRSKRLVVIRDPGVSRPLLELTLAHELVHALDDQRFGLDIGEGVRDDEVLAEASLAEGTATAVMADYAAAHLGLADVLSIADAAQDAGLPEFIERQLLFPYLAGEEFVSVLRGQSGGWKAVDSVYRYRRPRTTEQVIHPRKFAAGERGARVAVPDLSREGWRRLQRSSVGEFEVQMLLALNDARRRRRGGGGMGWRALRAVAANLARMPCTVRACRPGLASAPLGHGDGPGGGRDRARPGIREGTQSAPHGRRKVGQPGRGDRAGAPAPGDDDRVCARRAARGGGSGRRLKSRDATSCCVALSPPGGCRGARPHGGSNHWGSGRAARIWAAPACPSSHR